MKEFLSKRALTAVYLVTGDSLPSFINRLVRAGITVLRAEAGKNGVILTIPRADSKKLFAICKDMCYNIIIGGVSHPENPRKNRITVRHLRDGGYLSPAYAFFKRAGLVIGVVAFLAFTVLCDRTLLGVSLKGVPTELKGGVSRTLTENGVKKYVRFSSIDTAMLSSEILSDNPAIGFASVYKRGSYLVVEALRVEAPGDIRGKEILSDVDGVVEKISVLRGTPLVSVGDVVKAGQQLVGGYFIAGEETFKTDALAEIYIRGTFAFNFITSGNSEYYVDAAVAVAKEKCPFSNIIGQKTDITQTKNGYNIKVDLTFVKLIGG